MPVCAQSAPSTRGLNGTHRCGLRPGGRSPLSPPLLRAAPPLLELPEVLTERSPGGGSLKQSIGEVPAKVASVVSLAAQSPSSHHRAEHSGAAGRLMRATIVACVALWYVVSFLGIVVNKQMLSTGNLEPGILAMAQTCATVLIGGLFEARAWRSASTRSNSDFSDSGLGQNQAASSSRARRAAVIGLLGMLRFSTIVLGLISLKHVAASFTETVKASGPFFTVVAAWILVGEKTSPARLVALLPVAGGLMLASATELSFTTIGFVAALMTNSVECVQNVFCKKLLTPTPGATEAPYSPQQLQYYSAVAALAVQIPFFLAESLMRPSADSVAAANGVDGQLAGRPSFPLMSHFQPDGLFSPVSFMLMGNGLLYYLQSALAYTVMSHFSPVTVAVLNTVKRALIICGTAVVFRNTLRPSTQVGTFICLSGACLYNIVGDVTLSLRSMTAKTTPLPQRMPITSESRIAPMEVTIDRCEGLVSARIGSRTSSDGEAANLLEHA